MKQNGLKSKKQAGRFVVVGIVNTAIDFVLLFMLRFFGLPAISANFISSTTAFVFSFAANKNYTFKSTTNNLHRQIVLFVIITLVGLWVFQNMVIYLTESYLVDLLNSQTLGLLISKLIATAVSMTWNYIMYATVVFPRDPTSE